LRAFGLEVVTGTSHEVRPWPSAGVAQVGKVREQIAHGILVLVTTIYFPTPRTIVVGECGDGTTTSVVLNTSHGEAPFCCSCRISNAACVPAASRGVHSVPQRDTRRIELAQHTQDQRRERD
jgi:hypothetical protein